MRSGIVGPDGNPISTDDDTEAKLRALLLGAFGALKGIARGPRGTYYVDDPDMLARFREQVVSAIVEAMGPRLIEQYYGISLQVRQQTDPHRTMVREPEVIQ